MSVTQQDGVLVIGAPRSGTSYTTKILKAHGVDFGSESLDQQEATARGLAGYGEDSMLESMLMVQANASGGGCGHNPPDVLLSLDDSTENIRGALVRDKEGDVIGLKSAGIVYAFPWWWEHILEGWGRWTVVVVVRNPLEVIASYYKMRSVPPAQTLALWKRTYQDIMLWEEMYGRQFKWVEFPSGVGMRSAITHIGLEWDAVKSADAWTPPVGDSGEVPSTFLWFLRFYEVLQKRCRREEGNIITPDLELVTA